jgi:hypothetical protein
MLLAPVASGTCLRTPTNTTSCSAWRRNRLRTSVSPQRLLEREEALRSKPPAGVAQELWSLGLLYNLIRVEMEQIAAEAAISPMRIGFKSALQFIQSCWLICSAMAPGRIPKKLRRLREDLNQFILPPPAANGRTQEPSTSR